MFGKNEEEQQQSESVLAANQQYLMNSPFMIMRIDTAPLIRKIHDFLSSVRTEYVYDEKAPNGWKEKVRKIGLPLANPEGIMRICALVEMRINPHTAQGNLKEEHYWDHIGRARYEITETIVKKCPDWEINDSNLNLIIDEICALIEVFLTRPIGDGERKSYSQQIQARENTVVQQQRGSSIQNFASGFGRGQ